MDKVYIILPVCNRRNITQKFVECLKSQTYTNYHLILVDDGSIDGTEEMVRSQIESLTVIKGNGNWWWAGGLQQGVDWLKENNVKATDIVLMANDDVTFDGSFIEKAINILQDIQKTLVSAQAFKPDTVSVVNQGVKADLKSMTFTTATSPEEINCLPTRSLFLRFSDLLTIGDFYPRILPHYCSDYEFTIRAYKKRLKLLVNPELKIYLHESNFINKLPSLESNNFGKFVQSYFSNKNPVNPLHWTVFVILVCPKLWILLNITRVWKGCVFTILKVISKKK
jgi:GT2 family glycosyltransferase